MHGISYISGLFFVYFLLEVAHGQLNIYCYVCEGEEGSNCSKGLLDQIKKEPCEGLCAFVTWHNGTVFRKCFPITFKQTSGRQGEFYNTPKEYEEKSWDCMKQFVGKRSCRKDVIRDTFINVSKCTQRHAGKYLNESDPRRGKLRDYADFPNPDLKSQCVCTYDLCNANEKTNSSGKSSSTTNCIYASAIWLALVYKFFN